MQFLVATLKCLVTKMFLNPYSLTKNAQRNVCFLCNSAMKLFKHCIPMKSVCGIHHNSIKTVTTSQCFSQAGSSLTQLVAFQTRLGIQICGNITKIFVRTVIFTDQTKTFEHLSSDYFNMFFEASYLIRQLALSKVSEM